MGLFVEGVEEIRGAFETAVFRDPSRNEGGRSERGIESLRNASFAMFRFKRKNQHVVTVECNRMKEAEPPPRRTSAGSRSRCPN